MHEVAWLIALEYSCLTHQQTTAPLYCRQGVYFALTSSYSNNYAQADGSGIKSMFVCRVLAGETSQGHNEQVTPEVRIAATNQMYDSTTDSIDSPEPSDADPGKYGGGVRQMYVVYHDAQAYPEYLIRYKA